MKKILLLILTLLLLFSSCQRKSGSTPPSISVSIIDRNLISPSEGTYSNNRWTRWINENSPVRVEWVPIPKDNFEQVLSIMFNANNAPDLVVNEDRNLMQLLADKALIQPIENYVNEYSTEYSAYMEQHKYLRMYTQLNQKEYLFTSESQTVADSCIWLRQDWLDSLALPTPKNVDELLEVARAFTYNDPDKNGLNDSIGILSVNDIIEQIFMVDNLWYEDENQNIYLSQLTQRYADMLIYKRQLFEEGLIDKSFLIDSDSSTDIQPWLDGKYGILFSTWNAENFRRLLKNDTHAEVSPISNISTKYGDNGTRHKSVAGNYVAFNSSMNNPPDGVKFIDWMITSGYIVLLNGIKGEHNTQSYGNIVPIDVEKNNVELKYASYDMPIVRNEKITPEKILSAVPENSELDKKIAFLSSQALSLTTDNNYKQDIPAGISSNIIKVRNFEKEWGLFTSNTATDFILSSLTSSPVSKEELMIQLQNGWQRLGGDSVRTLMQQWYDENKYSFVYSATSKKD